MTSKGKYSQPSNFCSQLVPVKPCLQWQEYPAGLVFEHHPLFWQGLIRVAVVEQFAMITMIMSIVLRNANIFCIIIHVQSWWYAGSTTCTLRACGCTIVPQEFDFDGLIQEWLIIGVEIRGAVGALAPTTCSWWGQCPHNQSHPVCAILGLAMIYHLKFMNKKATKYAPLVFSSLELRVLRVFPTIKG